MAAEGEDSLPMFQTPVFMAHADILYSAMEETGWYL